jgi:hypothetical protein
METGDGNYQNIKACFFIRDRERHSPFFLKKKRWKERGDMMSHRGANEEKNR